MTDSLFDFILFIFAELWPCFLNVHCSQLGRSVEICGGLQTGAASVSHNDVTYSEELPTGVHWNTLRSLRYHYWELSLGLCRGGWQLNSCTVPNMGLTKGFKKHVQTNPLQLSLSYPAHDTLFWVGCNKIMKYYTVVYRCSCIFCWCIK